MALCLPDNDSIMPDYSELPPEILIKIFRQLSFYDVQAVGLCCKKWYAVTKLPEFDSKGIIQIVSCPLDNDHPAAEVILNKKIERLYLKSVQFGKVDKLFMHIGKSLKELTMKLVPITTALGLTFKYFPYLHTLNVSQVMASLIEDVELPPVSDLMHLRKLILIGNDTSVNRYLMSYCTDHTQNLTWITIEFSQKEEQQLLNLLQKHARTLTRADLRFYQNMHLDAAKWTRAFESLNLQELGLQGNFCSDILVSATKAQVSLRSLDVTGSVSVNDDYLGMVGDKFPTLERLILSYCGRITNAGMKHLTKLTRLKTLDVSCCNYLTSEGVRNIFGQLPNWSLQELHLQELHLDADLICFLAINLPNLKVYNLSGCSGNAVTNLAIQEVFDCQRNLVDLCVDNCFLLSESGILGYDTGNSIQCLKNLERLSLRGCKQISDIALSCGLRLPGLKFLDISHCNLVTNCGLKSVILHCPGIEEISVTYGKKIDYTSIRMLIDGLGRLRIIKVNNCLDPSQFRLGTWNVYRFRKLINEVTLKKSPR